MVPSARGEGVLVIATWRDHETGEFRARLTSSRTDIIEPSRVQFVSSADEIVEVVRDWLDATAR